MFVFKEQPLTKWLPKPEDGKIYEFDYGIPQVHYKTGDKVSEEQDTVIMLISKQDSILAYQRAGQPLPKSSHSLTSKCWFKCRICGKLAYGNLNTAKSSPRYNPCGCWSLIQKTKTGKKTGPINSKKLVEYCRSAEGRAMSSRNGKLYGSKNIDAVHKWQKDNPELSHKISSETGKRTIKYAREGLKKWQSEHPEEVKRTAKIASNAALKWQKSHPEEWEAVWKKNISKAIATSKGTHCSKGEQKVKEILENKGIDFIQEYEMMGLVGKYGRPRRLDFYFELDENKIAIEVDGEQHNDPNHFFNKNRYDGDSLQRIDAEKQKWCEEHGINLFRLKYKDIKIFEEKIDENLEQFKNFLCGKTEESTEE